MTRESFDPMKPLPGETPESVAADVAEAEREISPDTDMNDHMDDAFITPNGDGVVHPPPEMLQ
jgi:hypothetical protein